MYNLWKITPFLSKIDSKRSPGRSFHGHNLHPRVTGFVQACSFLFFPSMIFLMISPIKKGWFVRQIYAIKNVGHHARSNAKDHPTSWPGQFIEKQLRARIFARLSDFYAQYSIRSAILRNNLQCTYIHKPTTCTKGQTVKIDVEFNEISV